ncbi:MAG: nitrate reductase cytochrome c-type subunit [Duodenibacillus sp.]
MKKVFVSASICLAAALAVVGCTTSTPVDIDKMSLEQTSPFETPTPKAFSLNAGQYRETQFGAPAMVPHAVDRYTINKGTNACMMCHGNTDRIGAAKVKGMPTSMPATHWTKVDGKLVMQASRHECTLCHAPQADVTPLVPTTN